MMASEGQLVNYGYNALIGFLLYCVIYDNYHYLILLAAIHALYKNLQQKYAQLVDPKGRGILITGCDTGFGHFVAKRLADRGFSVFAGCYKFDGEGAKTLRNYRKGNLHVLELDVTDDVSVQKAVSTVEEQVSKKGLWAVLNNAAINRLGDFEFTSVELMKQVAEVNYYGVVRVTKACLPMLRKSQGRIVNVTSVKGRIALPSDNVYISTKWALEALSDILRRELKRFGVKVVIVEPGNFGGITGMLNEQNQQLVTKAMNDGWDNASDNVKQAYGRACVDETLKGISEASTTSAETPDAVLDAMEDAVCNTEPQCRYLVHGGKKPLDWYCVCALMHQFLPEKIVDYFIELTSPQAKVAKQVK